MTEKVDTSAAAIAAVMDGVTPGLVEAIHSDELWNDHMQDYICSLSFDADIQFIAWCFEGVPAISAELTALRAERERDHANINLKADFIAATVNDLAQMEAERDALQQAQTYRYIGKDGKSILARDLEDQRDAALARVTVLEVVLAEAKNYLSKRKNFDGSSPEGIFLAHEGLVSSTAAAEHKGVEE